MSDRIYLVLTFITAPVSLIIMGWVTWWFIHQRGEKEDAERVAQIWRKRAAWGEVRCRQVIAREMAVGMTPEMARLAWGHPQAIQHPPNTETEHWLYDSDQFDTARQRITLEGGQVISWSGQPAAPISGVSPWLVITGLVGFAVLLTVVILVVVLGLG